jgi:DNA-binding MarR family transcriptional regulator
MESKDVAFLRFAGLVRRLFHQLRAMSESATPAQAGFTASHRGVLESLSAGGAQTVPALARARPVARQHIQVLVNDLAALGLVEMRPNPAHQRSPLVQLTPLGEERFGEIRASEKEVLRKLKLPFSVHELSELSARLELLSETLREWEGGSAG